MKVTDLIRSTAEWARRLAEENDFRPADASQAMRELIEAEKIGLAPLVSGNYFIGQRHLQASAGHAESFVRLIEIEAGAFGPQALVRASLEASARVKWLLDSQISLMERVVRGLAERLKSLEELRKLAREPQQQTSVDTRLQAIYGFAQRVGISMRPRPPATELIDDLFDVAGIGAPSFRDLSFAVHGQLPGLIAEMALNDPDVRLESVLRDYIPAASPVQLGTLLFLGTINAIDAERVFFGWEPTKWIEWRRAATAELKSLA